MTKKTNQEQSDIIDIDEERQLLSERISALRSELKDIWNGIQEAGSAKEKAKAGYALALDAGNEKGMSESLANIRSANNKRQSLIASLSGFSEKIPELEKLYGELMTIARRFLTAADELLRSAKADYEKEEVRYSSCQRISNSVGSLNEKLQKFQYDLEPDEKPEKSQQTLDDDIHGNV